MEAKVSVLLQGAAKETSCARTLELKMVNTSANPSNLELLQAARSEDLVYDQIDVLAVLGDAERKIVDTLKLGGAHLLQGARGMGKSMLLRRAEVELDKEFLQCKCLGVYVNFK